ncbi:BSCL2, partial [Cordylochernes scorpioides]
MERFSGHLHVRWVVSIQAIMHYKSWLYRLLQATFYSPFLFTGSYEEKQLVSVVLFEAYEENPHNVTTHIVLQVQNPKIEIYSSVLKIHATFTGLRYYMFYWPLTTGFFGVTTIFFFLSLIALFSWYHYTATPPFSSAGFLHGDQDSSYGGGSSSSTKSSH